MTPRERRAVLAILSFTVLWGLTFVWMKQVLLAGTAHLGEGCIHVVVGLYLAARFGLAALVLPLVVPTSRRGWDRAAHRGGAILGLLLSAGFLLQIYGLELVPPSVSAFLTSLYVLFTAVLTAAWKRSGLRAGLALGVLLATLGGAFISGPPQVSFDAGEWLTVGCAFLFAVHILAVDHWTKRAAPLAITEISFVWVAVAGSVALALGLAAPGAPGVAETLELLTVRGFAVPLVLASLLATVVAISMMNVFQRDLDPVRAAILYAIEPIWASIAAIAMGLAVADVWLWVGGSALFAGNLVAELRREGGTESNE